jgi:hypothetical protein
MKNRPPTLTSRGIENHAGQHKEQRHVHIEYYSENWRIIIDHMAKKY